MTDYLDIDGAQGEGGGQILRTALSLSLLTQTPVRIHDIRKGRSKPGLARQHLVCVKAAAALGAAQVDGAELGATEVRFVPKTLLGGAHHFAIGTAGSSILVLQTLLPALLAAPTSSRIVVEGGTHNLLAPSSCFFMRCFLPALKRMGAQIDLEIEREGLYPGGGGRVVLTLSPGTLQPVNFDQRGALVGIYADAISAGVAADDVVRQLNHAAAHFRLAHTHYRHRELPHATGPGSVLSLWAQFESSCELVSSHHRSRSAAAAAPACEALAAWLKGPAVVGEHLCDQLLLPMWLSGAGSMVCASPSLHTRTNIAVIQQFGGARFGINATANGVWRIKCGDVAPQI